MKISVWRNPVKSVYVEYKEKPDVPYSKPLNTGASHSTPKAERFIKTKKDSREIIRCIRSSKRKRI